MNISALILEYLKVRHKATLTGFGDFLLENAAAVLNPEHKTLLPPAQKITYKPDYEAQGPDFEYFVAEQKGLTAAKAAEEIKSQITFWKNKINEGENFTVEGLGIFKISADSVHFEGNRVEGDHSDFYGLEEINLVELGKSRGKSVTTSERKEYSVVKSWVWLFLLALPIGALAYFGVTQPEMLFGRKSFTPASLETMKDTVKIVAARKDTVNSMKVDSAIADSNNTTAAVPVAPKTWKSKKNTTKKWRKPKKQGNHSR
jgi:nucleoid DNA-binding protein